MIVPKLKEEQQKIAGCLSSLDELITAQSQNRDALKTQKKALMQQLFPNIEAVAVNPERCVQQMLETSQT